MRVLEKGGALVGPEQPITVVFDRGGWSTKLFNEMIKAGYDFIPYRRGHDLKIARTQFRKCTFVHGTKTYEYELHDKPRVRVGKTGNKKGEGPKYVWMRQVTRLDGKHQVPVITTRTDLPPEEVVFLMFNRWRQENFFKYMIEEFALDALLEYGTEPLPADADRPNPAIRKIDKKLHRVKAKLKEAEQELGQRLRANCESSRPTVRGFKIAHAHITKKIGLSCILL